MRRSVVVCLMVLALCLVLVLPATSRAAHQVATDGGCPGLGCSNGHCVSNPGQTMCLYTYDPETGRCTCTGTSAC